VKVNQQITAREVRVIEPDGKQAGILPLTEALTLAAESDLDLVEVSPAASPPVCRIMDYGKFKYQQSKRSQATRKKRVQSIIHVKEVKVRPSTEEHDLKFKVGHIKRFLAHGDKAKVSLRFRGREITHIDLGRHLLERIAEEVKEEGIIEQPPKLEGRNMIMVIAPKH
jgi:translation initiation factor IF-3